MEVYHKAVKENLPITNEYLKTEFKKLQNGIQEVDFHQFFNQYYEEGQGRLKASTLKTYTTFYNTLLKYEKAKRKRLTFNTVDLDFYYAFQSYCYNDLKFSTNYFGKLIKILKSVMNEALTRGLTNNNAFQTKKFKKLGYLCY